MQRWIIITGANNGIGLAMSRTLLEMGERVAALDLSTENLPAHPHLLAFVCDVTDAQGVQACVDEVVRAWGGVDVLVNNACLALFKPFTERSLEDTHREFEVNYFGYVHTIQAVLPVMRQQKAGTIHNLSSGVGFTGMPGMSGYTSTKGAIEALTRTLALELADDGITVNVMHPPLTRTKSASGLGVPPEMMDDPQVVGRGLARQVGSHKPFITHNFGTGLGIWAQRHFPLAMGQLLSKMTRRAVENKKANSH
jgi:NAD(P)-dependent dehydrogenase (short-subunit alcohol dehydrogenase family)